MVCSCGTEVVSFEFDRARPDQRIAAMPLVLKAACHAIGIARLPQAACCMYACTGCVRIVQPWRDGHNCIVVLHTKTSGSGRTGVRQRQRLSVYVSCCAVWCALHVVRCMLCVAWCALHGVRCMVCVAWCALCSVLPCDACCMLSGACPCRTALCMAVALVR